MSTIRVTALLLVFQLYANQIASWADPCEEKIAHKISKFLGSVSGPVAVLVQDEIKVVEKAGMYLEASLEHRQTQNELWFMKFNSSGLSDVLLKAQTINANKLAKTIISNEAPDFKIYEGGAAFFSILKAARILPVGAGMLLFTHGKVKDNELVHLALKETLQKQIKLCVAWLGSNSKLDDEKELIRNAASLSQGVFFTATSLCYEIYLHGTENAKAKSVEHQVNISGPKTLRIPIDDRVSAMHISITPRVDEAYIISPRGYLIDLLNATSVDLLSIESNVANVDKFYEIQLNTMTTPIAGIWLLQTESAQIYNLTVAIQNDSILQPHTLNAEKPTAKQDVDKVMQNLELENETAIETVDVMGVSDFGDSLPAQSDKSNENEYKYYDSERSFTIPAVTADIGLGSELIIQPNQQSNLYFEVTNNRDQPIVAYFECRDDKSLLRWMQPTGTRINGRQKTVVTVAIYSRPGLGDAYYDTITFTAKTALERYEKTIHLNVASKTRLYDSEPPRLWHSYLSDCLNVLIGQCQDATWTIKVTAQDRETGLLQLSATPQNLYFPTGYTSGTKEEVTGYYSGSCCEPTIQLSAVDLMNNRRSYTADAYKAALGAGAISAIVLGIILLLIIIIVIICLCKGGKCGCRRKQSESVDLPRYRGPVNSSSTTRY